MTRRILAAFLGLTLTLLIGVVVPLGVMSVNHDRHAFADETVSAASALASAAEEQLADHQRGAPFLGTLTFRPALIGNDEFAVYDIDGRVVIPGPAHLRVAQGQVAAALSGQTVQQWQDEPQDGLLVLRPAYSGSRIVGATAVQRTAEPLNEQIASLWLGLGLTGLIAILLATTLSIGLARWVGRPLRRLDAAADRLGAGELTVRASTLMGPPETRHLASTFNDMAGRLEALIGSHRTLVADISHQLRTPLAALRLRLELLHDDVDGTAAGELDGALGEIARLSRLVDGLLAVARAEHTRPAPVTVDLRQLVRERVAIWSRAGARTSDPAADILRPRQRGGHTGAPRAGPGQPLGQRPRCDPRRRADHRLGPTSSRPGPAGGHRQRAGNDAGPARTGLPPILDPASRQPDPRQLRPEAGSGWRSCIA